MTETTLQKPRKLPAAARFAMQVQVFLLRRNLLGAMSEQIMVITTTGRKSGKIFSTPIGYMRDGDSIVSLTNGSTGGSNWYRNLLSNPVAVLEIKGRKYRATASPIADEEERRRLFERYKNERGAYFRNYFGVTVDASPEVLEKALASRKFLRFRLDAPGGNHV